MPLFASYRWRRRFIWLLLIAVLAVVGTALAVEFPNGKVTNEAPLSKRPIHIAPSGTPKTVRLTAAKKASALAVAGVFVHTAVARKHLDRSWPLLTRKLTQGLTRRQWD